MREPLDRLISAYTALDPRAVYTPHTRFEDLTEEEQDEVARVLYITSACHLAAEGREAEATIIHITTLRLLDTTAAGLVRQLLEQCLVAQL